LDARRAESPAQAANPELHSQRSIPPFSLDDRNRPFAEFNKQRLALSQEEHPANAGPLVRGSAA